MVKNLPPLLLVLILLLLLLCCALGSKWVTRDSSEEETARAEITMSRGTQQHVAHPQRPLSTGDCEYGKNLFCTTVHSLLQDLSKTDSQKARIIPLRTCHVGLEREPLFLTHEKKALE